MPQAIFFMIHGMGDPEYTDSDTGHAYCQGFVGVINSVLTSLGIQILMPYIPVDPDAVSGFTLNSDPVEPFGQTSPISIQVADKDGILSRAFFRDMGDTDIDYYELEDKYVTATQTDFIVWGYGGEALVGSDFMLWLEEEAVQVVTCTPFTGGYALEVVRGAMGSTARAHFVGSRRWSGRDGTDVYLNMSTKPEPDRYKFPTSIYAIEMAGGIPQSVIFARHGFLADRPRPRGTHYEFLVDDATSRIASHEFGSCRPSVPLSHCINMNQAAVTSIGKIPAIVFGQQGNKDGVSPYMIEMSLTRREAEQIFGPPFHIGDIDSIDETLCNYWITLASSGFNAGTARHKWLLQVELSAWSGSFFITSMFWEQAGYAGAGQVNTTTAFLKIYGVLAEHYSGTLPSITAGIQPTSFIDGKPADFPQGLSFISRDIVRPEEAPPKITLSLLFYDTPINAFLHLATSNVGDGSNGAYDTITFGIGARLPLDLFNLGTVADAPDIDPATNELLKLNVLLSKEIAYPIRTTGEWAKFKNFWKNEMLANTLLVSTVDTTGAIGFVNINRAVTIGVIPTITREIDGPEIQQGGRLKPIDHVVIEYGFMGKDLAPRDTTLFRPHDADTIDDTKSGMRIRIWEHNSLTQEASYKVQALAGYYLQQLRTGAPVWKIPTSMFGLYTMGQYIRWTHPTMQSAAGVGISVVAVVIGTDHDLSDGRHYAVVMTSAAAQATKYTARVAPAYLITTVRQVSGEEFELKLRPFAEQLFGNDPFEGDVRYANEGTITTLVANESRVRIFNPQFNCPTGERNGWLKAYALMRNTIDWQTITVLINGIWERGDLTFADLLVAGKSYLVMTDVSYSNGNLEGALIIPDEMQRDPNEFALARYSAVEPSKPFAKTFHTYG